MKNEFQNGNKAAEKWPENKVLLVLNTMLEFLWRSDVTGERIVNPVRANKIKLRKEVCLLADVTQRQWQHIKKKFTNKTSPYFSEEVTTIIEKIEETCECRLINSGTAMDILILKSHYGYCDQIGNIITTKQPSAVTNIIVPKILVIKQGRNRTKTRNKVNRLV